MQTHHSHLEAVLPSLDREAPTARGVACIYTGIVLEDKQPQTLPMKSQLRMTVVMPLVDHVKLRSLLGSQHSRIQRR